MGEIDGIHEIYFWKALDDYETLNPDEWTMWSIDQAGHYNRNRGKGKPAKGFEDWFPRKRKKPEQAPEQIGNIFRAAKRKKKRKSNHKDV